MSRYIYTSGTGTCWEIVVGWDFPLETLFAKVWDRRRDGTGYPALLELWVGDSPGEIVTVEHLDSELAPYGTIPKTIKLALANDLQWLAQLTPDQKRIRKLIA